MIEVHVHPTILSPEEEEEEEEEEEGSPLYSTNIYL